MAGLEPTYYRFGDGTISYYLYTHIETLVFQYKFTTKYEYLETSVGFEPTINTGVAVQRLEPLGYEAIS